jgi:hypothetical protein
MLPHFIWPLTAIYRLERAGQAFDEAILRGPMAGSYSLGSPNVCTRGPIEGRFLPTKMFRPCSFLTVHAGTVSSTQESYFADGNNESSLDELIRQGFPHFVYPLN